jgi:two-component system response regulator
MTVKKEALAPILMAEDDADDRMLAEKAMRESKIANPLVTVTDGEELLEYLRHQGKYSNPEDAPDPCFILLDLNMPRMDGREALRIIKEDEKLKKIPVIIMTTSQSEEDILVSYNVGVNSYITKPLTFAGLVNVIRGLKDYWLEVVKLPENVSYKTSAILKNKA